MSERSRRTSTQQSTSTDTGSSVAAVGGSSNAQLAESTRTAEGTAAGLANYQAALGQWLGGELYGAVAGHLTLEAMSGHANSALMSALKSLSSSLDNLNPSAENKALQDLAKSLQDEFGTAAGDWLEQNGAGFCADLADWVDANPILIVTAAMLAAAGAYLANASIPELSQAFNMGEFKAELGAKLGRLRDISLEQVSLELSHATAPLVASVKVSPGGEQVKTEIGASLGSAERKVYTSGEFVGDNLNVLNVGGVLTAGNTAVSAEHNATMGNGGQQTTNVNIETKDGNITRTNNIAYDSNTDVLTVKNILSQVDGKNSTTIESVGSSDGNSSETVSLARDLGGGLSGTMSLTEAARRMGVGNSYELSTEQKASLGLNYDTRDLDAAMTINSSTSGNHSASGSVDYTPASGWQMGADAAVKFGQEDTLEAGAYFGFRNPNEFQTYMGKYRFKDDVSQSHDLDLMVEERFGPIYTRLQQNVAVGLTGTSWTTTAQGAYFVNDNFALIGGAQYSGNNAGDESFAPQIGAQIHGVPLIVTHDFDTQTTTIGFTFKFGR